MDSRETAALDATRVAMTLEIAAMTPDTARAILTMHRNEQPSNWHTHSPAELAAFQKRMVNLRQVRVALPVKTR